MNKLAKSKHGFQFLCNILCIIYKTPQKKSELFSAIHEGAPLSKEHTAELLLDWVRFSARTKEDSQFCQTLLKLLSNYYGKELDASSYFYDIDYFSVADSEKKLKAKFNNIFVNQNGPLPDMLAGLAVTLTFRIGYQGNPQFYIGTSEVRQILTEALSILEISHIEFISDKCFELTDGKPSAVLTNLFIISLFGALRSVYPHKQTQKDSNILIGKDAVTKFIYAKESSLLTDSLKQVDEAATICEAMWSAYYEKTKEVLFPNNLHLQLTSFYHIPDFEPMANSHKDILRCDKGFMIRSIVIGNKGCGKTLLTNAIVNTCLHSSNEETKIYQEYCSKLGLESNHYLPLVLHCDQIPPDTPIEQMDILNIALLQLTQLVRTTRYQNYLKHWPECQKMILEYCQQKAKNSTLLLIIDDFSSLDSQYYEAFLSRLRQLGDYDFPRLHILITSQRLPQSLMRHFGNYNQVEIAPLSICLERTIEQLSHLGVSYREFKTYQKLLRKNRYIVKYLNSPAHLIKLLNYPFDDYFDIEELLTLTIDEQLEQHSGSLVSEADCREFLTILAVNIAENKGVRHSRSHMDCQSIPMNITSKRYLTNLKDSFQEPESIWKYIRDKMILICPSNSINSFMFSNQLFYYSLVADYYLELLTHTNAEPLLCRFNYMSCEDFSYIIVILMKRLCQKEHYQDSLENNISEYNRKLLIQSIAAYVISCDELTDICQCLMALHDILYHPTIKSVFTHHEENTSRKRLWNILIRTYQECYHRYQELTEN